MENPSTNTQIRVMLVEDNDDLATITALLLQRHGFEVTSCKNGKECIDQAKDSKPDLILLDVEMPVMDGITACKYIRQQSWGLQIPIIALTGYGKGLASNWFKDAGFDMLLPKPVNFLDLTTAITDALRQKGIP